MAVVDAQPPSRFGHLAKAIGVVLLVAAVVAAILVITAASGPAEPDGSWSAQEGPNPSKLSRGTFSAISCPARRSCVGVGSYGKGPDGPVKLFSSFWDGRRWTTRPMPKPPGEDIVAEAVFCTSIDFCTMVGNFDEIAGKNLSSRGYAELWDGSQWSLNERFSKAAGGSILHDVVCMSPHSCFAIGEQGVDVVLQHWDGSRWSPQKPPLPRNAWAQFSGLSCDGNTCMAVGAYADESFAVHPLAEHWNGTKWTVLSPPEGRELWPNKGGELAEPEIYLSSVSCIAGGCTAVGHATKLVEGKQPALYFSAHWDEDGWSWHELQDRGETKTGLPGVIACSATDSCFTVGSNLHGRTAPYVTHWNGDEWSALQALPLPGKATAAGLSGLSCGQADACTAVGFSTMHKARSNLTERFE